MAGLARSAICGAPLSSFPVKKLGNWHGPACGRPVAAYFFYASRGVKTEEVSPADRDARLSRFFTAGSCVAYTLSLPPLLFAFPRMNCDSSLGRNNFFHRQREFEVGLALSVFGKKEAAAAGRKTGYHHIGLGQSTLQRGRCHKPFDLQPWPSQPLTRMRIERL